MVFEGTVINGRIVLDEVPVIPDGTRVKVEVVSEPASRRDQTGSSLATLLEFAGLVKDLPPDMARNHDHYLHGAPKR